LTESNEAAKMQVHSRIYIFSE